MKEKRLEIFKEMLNICLGRSFSNQNVMNIIKENELYSSGQKILIKMISDFLSSVEEHDLVLIDEPETYLHPQGVSNFYHCLNKMLNYTKSFCIMTTHSPINCSRNTF